MSWPGMLFPVRPGHQEGVEWQWAIQEEGRDLDVGAKQEAYQRCCRLGTPPANETKACCIKERPSC